MPNRSRELAHFRLWLESPAAHQHRAALASLPQEARRIMTEQLTAAFVAGFDAACAYASARLDELEDRIRKAQRHRWN